ncbi:MAG: hypothetical protein HY430_02695 [Candidatus Levybacteria bacterium]|nr:hypothetical protein [Candidatus Levybacteria bacterium]
MVDAASEQNPSPSLEQDFGTKIQSELPISFVPAAVDPIATGELARRIEEDREITSHFHLNSLRYAVERMSKEKLIPFFTLDLREIPELRDSGITEDEKAFVLDKIGLRHAVAMKLLIEKGFLTEDQTWTPQDTAQDHFRFLSLSHETQPMIAECFSSFSDREGNPYVDGFVFSFINPHM